MQQSVNKLGELLDLPPQTSMTDLIFKRISNLILEGKLSEGYVFPNETVMCEELGVGRSTLREAYKALELSGYISRSKQGTVVNSKIEIMNYTSLQSAFSSASRREFVEFRTMVETWSAACAASSAGMSDIEELESMIEQMEEVRNQGDFDTLMEMDKQFHLKICRLSNNSLISTMVSVMDENWKNGIAVNFENLLKNKMEVFDMMANQHKAVVAAIRDGDSLLAGELMMKHLETVSIKE